MKVSGGVGCLVIVVAAIVIGVIARNAAKDESSGSSGGGGGGGSSCEERDRAERQSYEANRAAIGRSEPKTMGDLNKILGSALDCDDVTCTQGPCARCYWIYQGCHTVGRIHATVEKWGTPLDVRNGSGILAMEYSDN